MATMRLANTAAAQPLCRRPCLPSYRCTNNANIRQEKFLRCYSAANGNGSGSSGGPPISGARRMSETGMTASGTMLTSKRLGTLTVRDMMVSPAYSLTPETEVTDAMEFLVEKGISGAPVTSKDGQVIGVISGYDLLALDCTPGKLDRSYFPPVDTCINEFGGDRKMMWSNFKSLRQKLKSATGTTVREAMHKAFIISPDATMEEAANMIVQKRAHRICVCDPEGVFVGVVSRGDIMRATIATFKAYMSKQDAKDAREQPQTPQ